jgi:hypothetical protein
VAALRKPWTHSSNVSWRTGNGRRSRVSGGQVLQAVDTQERDLPGWPLSGEPRRCVPCSSSCAARVGGRRRAAESKRSMHDEIVALCSRSSSSLLRCAPRLGRACAAVPVAAVHWPLRAQVLLGTVLRGLETELSQLKSDVESLMKTMKKEMSLKVRRGRGSCVRRYPLVHMRSRLTGGHVARRLKRLGWPKG